MDFFINIFRDLLQVSLAGFGVYTFFVSMEAAKDEFTRALIMTGFIVFALILIVLHTIANRLKK